MIEIISLTTGEPKVEATFSDKEGWTGNKTIQKNVAAELETVSEKEILKLLRGKYLYAHQVKEKILNKVTKHFQREN